jgi:uncharacterized UBP type Zn finger protein
LDRNASLTRAAARRARRAACRAATLLDSMKSCTHLGGVRAVTPSARGCEDCLRIGDTWVHLRLCLTCGHVGCCDSSKNKHATKHFRATGHPIVRSFEKGENWAWCYVDDMMVDV